MNIKTVSVQFVAGNYQGNPKCYEYLTDLDVKVNDIAVVDSPSDGFVTVKVRSVALGEVGKASKFLVQLVDDTHYKGIAERYSQRRDIIRKLESKKKQVEEMQVWKWLADNDSEAAALLEQLKKF